MAKQGIGCGAKIGLWSAFIGLASAVIAVLVVVYPVSLTWGEDWLCPDSTVDSHVLRIDGVNADGDSTTNFEVFCMADRGVLTKVPWYLAVIPVLVVVLVIPIVTWIFLSAIRALFRGMGGTRGDPEPAPFPTQPQPSAQAQTPMPQSADPPIGSTTDSVVESHPHKGPIIED